MDEEEMKILGDAVPHPDDWDEICEVTFGEKTVEMDSIVINNDDLMEMKLKFFSRRTVSKENCENETEE